MRQIFIWLMGVFAPVMVLGQHNAVKNKTIVWDQATLKSVSEKDGNYARMIQLKGGNLLCVYQSKAGIMCITSNDQGKTWLKPEIVTASFKGMEMAVPEVLELKDHSLLLSYNPRPYKINGSWDTTKHFAICTKKSYDKGKTWTDERLIYEAHYNFDDGCWEPSQIQLPSGEIQLFFSNEGVYTKSNEQNISIFRSKDNGLSWTKEPEIVSFRPNHRDGMPAPSS
jgi:Neuraminidase (sialidase)